MRCASCASTSRVEKIQIQTGGNFTLVRGALSRSLATRLGKVRHEMADARRKSFRLTRNIAISGAKSAFNRVSSIGLCVRECQRLEWSVGATGRTGVMQSAASAASAASVRAGGE